MDRDEAFEMGLQWAYLYPEGSPSRSLIEKTMETSYLVNIVANDFKDGQCIFEPFLLDQPKDSLINGNGVSGIGSTLVNGVNGVKDAVIGAVTGVLTNGSIPLTNGNGNGH
jgi:methylenetetrahydrofolate reductase (NADPH)